MFHFITIGILLPLISTLVQANVEKTIFLAPPGSTIPSVEPELDDLGLERLSPHRPVIRTGLNASFPTTAAPEGTDSWFFVENLKPGQRYEIRVCWLATQPTSFKLSTHPLAETFETPSLFTSLNVFSTARLSSLDSPLQANTIPLRANSHGTGSSVLDPAPTTDSVLFLRVQAAADYFTTDEALMRDVPPVGVDLILDPFLLNVFPRSLVPTAGWIVVVAVLAVFVARWVSGEVGRVVQDARSQRLQPGGKKDN
ncbi:hypothetical protein N7474_005483 [Penicillium riverlandense]|uniref:uncharacterized protein n=1 Tax=Penicillium riverlandense TaxID=1903569 RepID=UPI002547E3E1|nr:uncharacterized protein N7474_005483 [Penicillium riverlandense]KAJ5819892.1 hypothetical protein N7474_005483 [Penicillium riverlandense]